MKIAKYILPKLIKKNVKIFLAIIFISAIGVGTLTSMLNAYEGVKTTFSDYFETYNYPDVTIFSEQPFTEDILKQVETLEGVKSVQGRLCIDAEAKFGEQSFVSLRCYSTEDDDFTRYYKIETLKPEKHSDYIPMGLCANIVDLADFELGDVFELMINGKEYSCIFTEIVASPESTVVCRDKNSTFDAMEFGYAYFAYDELMQMVGVPMEIYNQALVFANPDVVPENLEKNICDSGILGNRVESYTYETSAHKIFIDDCIKPLKNMSYLVSCVFFLISVVMIYLFMYQVIMEQKEKTGILMALGSSSRQIVAVYLAFAVVVMICSGIVGNLLGLVLRELIGFLYQKAFYLPYVNNEFSWFLASGSVALVGIIIVFAISLATLQILRLDPADAMRKQPVVEGGVHFGKKFNFLSYANKVCFSCSLRNIRRLMLSFLSTILTVTLITFSFQITDACKHVISQTYDVRYQYDCQVLFERNLNSEEVQQMLVQGADGVASYEVFASADVQIKAENTSLDTTLYGIEEESKLLHLFELDGQSLSVTKDGIILSAKDAKTLGVKVDDEVLVGTVPLTVTGIYDANVFFVQYVNKEVFGKIAESECSGAYVKLKDGVSVEQFHAQLMGKEGFAYLSMKTKQEEGLKSILDKTNAAVVVILVLSLFVGMIIIYNMAVINFAERKRVFGIMMALGMKTTEIAWASLAEILIQYVVSLAVGILLGIGLGDILLTRMSTDTVQYRVAFSFSSGVIMAVCVGLFMLVGQVFALFKLRKLDIVEELKSRE